MGMKQRLSKNNWTTLLDKHRFAPLQMIKENIFDESCTECKNRAWYGIGFMRICNPKHLVNFKRNHKKCWIDIQNKSLPYTLHYAVFSRYERFQWRVETSIFPLASRAICLHYCRAPFSVFCSNARKSYCLHLWPAVERRRQLLPTSAVEKNKIVQPIFVWVQFFVWADQISVIRSMPIY